MAGQSNGRKEDENRGPWDGRRPSEDEFKHILISLKEGLTRGDGENFDGIDLSGFTGKAWDFRLARMNGAIFNGVRLDRKDLGHDKFQNVNFNNAVLKDAEFNRATFGKETSFQSADLEEAKFINAELPFAIFSGQRELNRQSVLTNLYKADFTDATLNDAKFEDTNLRECKFIDASLAKADMKTAQKLTAPQLAGADLTGAELPERLNFDQSVDSVRQVAGYARKLFTPTIIFSLFMCLAMFFNNGKELEITLLGVKVSAKAFLLISPIILLAMHFFLCYYLGKMFLYLSGLPARFTDGTYLDEYPESWWPTILVRYFVKHAKRPATSGGFTGRLSNRFWRRVSIVVLWFIPLLTFTLFLFTQLAQKSAPFQLFGIVVWILLGGLSLYSWTATISRLTHIPWRRNEDGLL